MNATRKSASTRLTMGTVPPATMPGAADVLITDNGLLPLTQTASVPSLAQWLETPAHHAPCVALAPEDDVTQLAEALGAPCADATDREDRAPPAVWEALQLIVIDFPQFSDGRGFSSARMLRLLGYSGELRARGELLPDQYALLRRAGFDNVQISAVRAQRQPETDWLADRRWLQPDYQQRMGKRKQDF